MESTDRLQALGQQLRMHGLIIGGLVLLLWSVEILDWSLGGHLDQFGIIPREIIGLRGVIAAPFLHGSFSHLAANSLPLIVLGWFVLLQGVRPFLIVTSAAVLVGGLGTWLVGPSASIHIGASGLIFGFFGFLLLRGYFERSWQSVLWSILVLVLYGGMLFGLLPTTPYVSWQMHLFGFVGGGIAAYLLSRRSSNSERSMESEIRLL